MSNDDLIQIQAAHNAEVEALRNELTERDRAFAELQAKNDTERPTALEQEDTVPSSRLP